MDRNCTDIPDSLDFIIYGWRDNRWDEKDRLTVGYGYFRFWSAYDRGALVLPYCLGDGDRIAKKGQIGLYIILDLAVSILCDFNSFC